jgi:ATP-dependent DNA helicase 2 subunit 1
MANCVILFLIRSFFSFFVCFILASNDLVDQMKKILSQLRMPKGYQPERYPNLQLEYFYKVLQALALDEPVPELTPDKTKPRYTSINNRAGDLIEHWNQLLSKEYHLHDRDEQQIEDGSAASGAGEEKRKKAKLPDHTDKDWEDAYDKDLISRYTVAQLKRFIESHGIKKGQNQQKAALVAAVNQYFRKQLGY